MISLKVRAQTSEQLPGSEEATEAGWGGSSGSRREAAPPSGQSREGPSPVPSSLLMVSRQREPARRPAPTQGQIPRSTGPNTKWSVSLVKHRWAVLGVQSRPRDQHSSLLITWKPSRGCPSPTEADLTQGCPIFQLVSGCFRPQRRARNWM